MNNLFKSIKVVALVLVAGLVGCKDNTDLLAIDAELAQNTMKGIYIYIDIDSTAVATTLHEWVLEETAAGRSGYYRVASTGNGLDGDVVDSLTWGDPVMAEDGLSMTIPVTLRTGGQKQLKWHDGVIEVDGYTTGKSLISTANTLRSVNENFANLHFEFNDTVSYITSRNDTVPYLAWKTEVVSWPQDSIDYYKQYLLDMADTLAWFNATYPDRAVPDTVRFSTKQQADGTYKGQISRSYETFEVQEILTNHGPLHIINSELVFDRSASLENTGSYYYHERTWTQECYTNPTDSAAEYTDYVSNVTNARWTPSAFTNVKKFNILFRGEWHMTLTGTVGGAESASTQMDETDYFFDVPLSAFNSATGEVTLGDHKYIKK